ncbi:Rap1a family protein [Devosia sp. CAU 1758]
MTIALAAAVVVFTVVSANAQGNGRPTLSINTFGELREQCRSPYDPIKQYCVGVVVGAMTMLEMLKPGTLCPPDNVRIDDLALDPFEILDAVPDFGGMPEAQGLLFGLGLAYKCQSEN